MSDHNNFLKFGHWFTCKGSFLRDRPASEACETSVGVKRVVLCVNAHKGLERFLVNLISELKRIISRLKLKALEAKFSFLCMRKIAKQDLLRRYNIRCAYRICPPCVFASTVKHKKQVVKFGFCPCCNRLFSEAWSLLDRTESFRRFGVASIRTLRLISLCC